MIEFYNYTDSMKLIVESEKLLKTMLGTKDLAILLRNQNDYANSIMRIFELPNGDYNSNILISKKSLATLCLNNFDNFQISSVSFPEHVNESIDLNSQFPIIWFPIYKQTEFKIIGVLEIASPRALVFNHNAMLEIEDSQVIDTFLKLFVGQLELINKINSKDCWS